MSRATIILTSPETRQRAAQWALKAPPGCRVEFKEAKRTTEQNALMWACLTEIARQQPYHGLRLTADDWKLVFLDALNREMRIVPNLDGTGFVNLGRSSSDLSKADMADLITLIQAYADKHGIALNEPVASSEDDAAPAEQHAPGGHK